MTLFPEKPKDEKAEALARQFRDTLIEKRRSRGVALRTFRQSWVADFAKLIKDKGELRVVCVLEWYCKHMGEEFVPAAYSSKYFRDRFEAIEAAMTRHEDNPNEQVDPLSRWLGAAYLGQFTFPPEIAAKLAVIVSRTRTRWHDFSAIMSAWHADNKDQRGGVFIDRIMQQYSLLFAKNWVEYLHQRFGHMSNYTGSVLDLAFKPSSEWFKDSFWRKWSQDYCGVATAFDDLLDALTGKGNK